MCIINDVCGAVEWKDIDAAEAHDPLFSSEYAPDIYAYMKEREVCPLTPSVPSCVSIPFLL